jgi:hypothetical protein
LEHNSHYPLPSSKMSSWFHGAATRCETK